MEGWPVFERDHVTKPEKRLGKARVYDCICGGRCVRPLHGNPKPCDCCDNDLTQMAYVVEDLRLRIRDMLKEAQGEAGV